MDFLFTYYSHRPAQLRRWHPGVGLALAGEAARERLCVADVRREFRPPGTCAPAVGLDVGAFLAERGETVRWVARPAAGHGRPARAARLLRNARMGHGLPAAKADVRHSATPLRLGSDGTDGVVESHRIRCSHFDAFRFFTDARPAAECAAAVARRPGAAWSNPAACTPPWICTNGPTS